MECIDLEVPFCLPLAVINDTRFWNIPKEPFHQVLLIRNQVVMNFLFHCSFIIISAFLECLYQVVFGISIVMAEMLKASSE